MNKKLLVMSVCIALSLPTMAQRRASAKVKAPATWAESIAAAKNQAHVEMQKTCLPIASKVIKAKEAAVPFSADITGLDEMVLYTWGTVDGTGDDQAVWANAKLVAADGSSVWLNDQKSTFKKTGSGSLRFNENAKGQDVVMKGKTYKRTIMANANAQIVVPLDKKYTRFEAEIGLENRSSAGTVIFRLQGITGAEAASDIVAKYPTEATLFLPFGGSDMKALVTTHDAAIEKHIATEVINLLNDKSYFTAQVAQIASKPTLDDQVIGYLNLAQEAMKVYQLQESLSWLNMRAIEEAYNDMAKDAGYDKNANQARLAELKLLTGKGFSGIYKNEASALEAANKALQLKRDILLANTALDMDKIIVGRYKIGTSARQVNPRALGTQNNNWSNQTSASRGGFNAEIAELSNLRGNVKTRTIFKPTNGSSVPDLKLHWDAERLMFSMVDTDRRWQVFEVKLDGTGLKKLIETPEKDLEFFDATYLPSGKLIAVSNIGYNGVPCVNGNDEVGNMCLYDPKDGSLRRLTFDQDANWAPTVMNNGRIMYTRWEYTDLTHYFSRFVMHMNPDGTEQKSLYGSGSYFPNSTFDAKPLPGGSSQFIGVISGHHGVTRSGRLMLFDPSKSRKSEKGMLQELPFRDRKIEPIVKDRLVDGVWPQFIKPYPLTDKYFLVTAKLNESALWGVYLIDIYDNLTLIAEFEGEGLICPTPVVQRPVPPVIPEKINLASKEATVFIQDIYEGEGLEGVPRGTVKAFRVLAYEYAYNRTPSDHWAQGVQSGWDIKRLLGTVPVEEDGSAIFTSEITLVPDEIHYLIEIKEYWEEEFDGKSKPENYRTKVPLIGIERNLRAALRKIGIPEDAIRTQEVGDYWRERGLEFLVSKRFDITLTDFSQIDEILKVIDTKGVNYMRIGELKNKDMQVYRQQGKIEALKAAQKKAEYLVEALGKRLGDVIRIVEPQESAGYSRYFAAQSNVSSSQAEAYDAFRTIKLNYSMLVRFEIK